LQKKVPYALKSLDADLKSHGEYPLTEASSAGHA
jgi:hypothetical protein